MAAVANMERAVQERYTAEALRRLNAVGYGQEQSGLTLNLVYNPISAHLPPPQAQLEVDYKRELGTKFGIRFNHLYTLTNMPNGKPLRLGEQSSTELVRLLARRDILVGSHCYGCTAGAGSSGGGALAA